MSTLDEKILEVAQDFVRTGKESDRRSYNVGDDEQIVIFIVRGEKEKTIKLAEDWNQRLAPLSLLGQRSCPKCHRAY